MTPLLPDVIVNGCAIPAERIAAEAQNHPAPKSKPGLAWKAAARALAVRELMLGEARSRQLVAVPLEISPGQWETDDEALIRQLLDQAIAPKPVTAALLRQTYENSPDRFRAPSLYEAGHILIPVQPGDVAGRAKAKAQATTILADLLADPSRFAELARTFSACPSRSNGGMLGQITAGDTVAEFDAALATMVEGSIAPEPVETRYGFHLIRLDARAKGEVLPFERVEAQMRNALEKRAWVQASRDFVADLVSKAEVSGVQLSAA